MSVSAEMIWDSAQPLLRSSVGAQTYNLWLQPIQATDLTDDCITLRTANEFSQAWLKGNYLGVLREVLAQTAQRPLQVKFKIGDDGLLEGHPASPATPQHLEAVKKPADNLATVSDGQFDSNYRFATFFVGASNDLAHAAALAVAQAPSHAYNPLFLYGGVGLGKTHLLHAIGQHVVEHKKRARVMYRSSEQFTNEFIENIQKSNLARFRKTCRQADVLLIDDVQFLAGKERIQEEFFHTFNALYDERKQIVLTCDRPANEVENLQKRLVSRFEGGLVAALELPDLETRATILRRKQISLGIELPEETVGFMASFLRTNVRQLEGALVRVASYARLIGKPLTADAVRALLADLWHQKNRQSISIEGIQLKVARQFDLRVADLTGKRRPEKIAFPRQIAMWLARKFTACSLTMIGEAFGGRDHGTVVHACQVVKDRMETDPNVRQVVLGLERLFQR